MAILTALLWNLVVFAERIPAAMWGSAIIGSLTLTGVFLTIRNAAKNLRSEREMTLRKEIYLAAGEAFAAGVQTPASMGDVREDDLVLTKSFLEKSPAISKMYLVARPGLMDSVGEAQKRINRAFIRAYRERYDGLGLVRDLQVARSELGTPRMRAS